MLDRGERELLKRWLKDAHDALYADPGSSQPGARSPDTIIGQLEAWLPDQVVSD
jgi:hypothetical protein